MTAPRVHRWDGGRAEVVKRSVQVDRSVLDAAGTLVYWSWTSTPEGGEKRNRESGTLAPGSREVNV